MERPDHPDSDRIEQAIRAIEAMRGAGPDEIIGRFMDVESLIYAAAWRGGAAGADLAEHLKPAATWIDGFLAGASFQELKARDEL